MTDKLLINDTLLTTTNNFSIAKYGVEIQKYGISHNNSNARLCFLSGLKIQY